MKHIVQSVYCMELFLSLQYTQISADSANMIFKPPTKKISCFAFCLSLAINIRLSITTNHPYEADWRIYVSVNRVIIDSDNGLSAVRGSIIVRTEAVCLFDWILENKHRNCRTRMAKDGPIHPSIWKRIQCKQAKFVACELCSSLNV